MLLQRLAVLAHHVIQAQVQLVERQRLLGVGRRLASRVIVRFLERVARGAERKRTDGEEREQEGKREGTGMEEKRIQAEGGSDETSARQRQGNGEREKGRVEREKSKRGPEISCFMDGFAA